MGFQLMFQDYCSPSTLKLKPRSVPERDECIPIQLQLLGNLFTFQIPLTSWYRCERTRHFSSLVSVRCIPLDAPHTNSSQVLSSLMHVCFPNITSWWRSRTSNFTRLSRVKNEAAIIVCRVFVHSYHWYQRSRRHVLHQVIEKNFFSQCWIMLL